MSVSWKDCRILISISFLKYKAEAERGFGDYPTTVGFKNSAPGYLRTRTSKANKLLSLLWISRGSLRSEPTKFSSFRFEKFHEISWVFFQMFFDELILLQVFHFWLYLHLGSPRMTTIGNLSVIAENRIIYQKDLKAKQGLWKKLSIKWY